jgi:hypothetical protein
MGGGSNDDDDDGRDGLTSKAIHALTPARAPMLSTPISLDVAVVAVAAAVAESMRASREPSLNDSTFSKPVYLCCCCWCCLLVVQSGGGGGGGCCE